MSQPSFWESTKTFEVNPGKTFATQPWFIAASVIGYLASLVLLSKYMERRQAIKVKTFTAVHNFILCGISFITSLGLLHGLLTTPIPEDIHRNRLFYFLFLPKGTPLVGRIYFWCYIYHLTKWYELIDSWIIVLRKAQKGLTFLHVLHHSLMLTMTAWWFAASFGATWLPALLNSMVHVVMYLYYGMNSLGHRWKLRHYITTIQLIQFSLGGLYFFIWIPAKLFGAQISGNLVIMSTCCFCDIYFYHLFYDFYQTEYRAKKARGQKADTPQPALPANTPAQNSLARLEEGKQEAIPPASSAPRAPAPPDSAEPVINEIDSASFEPLPSPRPSSTQARGASGGYSGLAPVYVEANFSSSSSLGKAIAA